MLRTYGQRPEGVEMKKLITCLTVFVLSGVTFATTWTVDDDGKADFDNIQEAVDAASDGDEIIVMPGTYTSTVDEVVDMRGKEIWLHSSKGAAVTFIDGEGTRRGIYCQSSETSNTIIEGLTIINGKAGNGGGMYTFFSNPTLRDCVFMNNYADINNYGGEGGGMYNSNSSPTVTNCTFTSNNASPSSNGNGGGMHNLDSNPTLTNCTFTYNTAPYGGGLRNKNSNPELIDCTFTDNTADVTGGGMYNGSSSPTLQNCIFENNTSETGGGIKNFNSDPILTNCEFTDNSSAEGGGMYNGQSDPSITACTFTNNVASLGGGGMYNTGSSNAVLTLCEFDGNSSPAGAGGAMQNKTNGGGMGKTLIMGCTFIDNIAESGGAVDNLDSNPTIEECSFESNKASVGDGGGIRNSGTSFPLIGSTAFCGNFDQNGVDGHIYGSYGDLGGNEFQDYCDCQDINGDGYVNVTDLLAVIAAWGIDCDGCSEDVNEDGIVDVTDLLIVVGSWGPCE
jgi:hypothetical protein